MNSKEILIFDISGEYGHFRKYNTTTSPLTYSIPTRTAIAGMLGAILGMERETSDRVYPIGANPVQEFFSKQNADIAVQIINPIKKENICFNLINTKLSFYDLTKSGRTQIEFELLKDLKFRIYLAMVDREKFNELSDRILNKKHYFTPYLGLAQFTAVIKYVGISTGILHHSKGVFIEVNTAVNLSKLISDNPVDFKPELFYAANNMPVEMNKEREVQEYSEILIEKTGHPVNVKVEEYVRVEDFGNILFL
jgi:CRISPR-associated protein Cas5h